MYKYKEYIGKTIKIIHLDGYVTQGIFNGYTSKENDEDGENITVKNGAGEFLSAYVSDIKSIEIETAKVHHLKCHDYFEYIIKELAWHNDDPSSELDHILANLMPWSEKLPKRLFRKDIPEN